MTQPNIRLASFQPRVCAVLFATVNKTKFTSPPGHTMWIFEKTRFSGTSRKKVPISAFPITPALLGGFQQCVCAVLSRDSKPKPTSSALSPPAAEKTEHEDFSEKKEDFLEHREKRSEFHLESALSGISEVDFLP